MPLVATPPLFESTIKSLPLLGRGKVRDIYAVGEDKLLIVTSDRLSAFDVILPDPIPGKGAVLTAVANFWFGKLAHVIPSQLTGIDPETVVADADERCLQQVHHGGQYLLPRQAAQRHVLRDLGPDGGQRAGELQHVLVLGALAHFAEQRMVFVLLAAPGIAPARLQVAVGLGADPDSGPRRRDGELADPLECAGVGDGVAVGLEVAKTITFPLAPDAARLIGYVNQAGRLGRIAGIDHGQPILHTAPRPLV